MKVLHIITFILVIVGALNWGLVGIFNFDLVARIFGEGVILSRIIYSVVGLAAVYEIVTHKTSCNFCLEK